MQTIKAQDLGKKILIDVRSPKEYSECHIPGAINIPLFDDLQRHEIGFLYKQVSVDEAYSKGHEYANKNMDKMMKEFANYKNKEIIIYCARGGMRSKSITQLLDGQGYKVKQLEGGIKAYKQMINDELENLEIPKLVVIYGLTGSRKTKLINELENSIDLEGCAGHRSSLFGAIGLKPTSQKMFTFLLYEQIKKLDLNKKVFIEGESRKIGDVQIPAPIWETMKKSKKIFLDVSITERAKHILEQYPDIEEKKEEYVAVIKKLKQALSKEKVEELLKNLDEKEYLYVVMELLEKYYDPRYKHFIAQRKIDETIKENDYKKTLEKLNQT